MFVAKITLLYPTNWIILEVSYQWEGENRWRYVPIAIIAYRKRLWSVLCAGRMFPVRTQSIKMIFINPLYSKITGKILSTWRLMRMMKRLKRLRALKSRLSLSMKHWINSSAMCVFCGKKWKTQRRPGNHAEKATIYTATSPLSYRRCSQLD